MNRNFGGVRQIGQPRSGVASMMSLSRFFVATMILLVGEASSAASAAQAQRPVAAQAVATTASLPIERGLYVFDGDCGFASDVFFYDGANIGSVGADSAGHWTNGAARISRVGPPRKPLGPELARAFRGFTLAWTVEGDRENFPSLVLKATGPGRFTDLSLGSFGELTYEKCAFTQLSRAMQTAVRAEQPQMVGGPPAQTGAVTPPVQRGTVVFPPVERGYYVWDMSCAKVQGAAPGALIGGLHYYDERRILYGGPARTVQRIEALAGNRYRLHYREEGEDGELHPSSEVMTVNSRTSFTDEYGNRHTHCPSAQIPRSIREQWGEFSRR